MADNRRILCLDFDGVIHSYDKGWQDGVIYGTVTEGFWEWAIPAEVLFRLVIYSSRSKEPAGVDEMKHWLEEQWRIYNAKGYFKMPVFEFAHEKPPAFVTIDDRAIQFQGQWSATGLNVHELMRFRPWNAR